MPKAGKVSSQSETSCVAQFAEKPAQKVVQIQTQMMDFTDSARLCQGLLEPSDFHILMGEAYYGDCGTQVEVSYQGTPMPGYTGWAVYFYYHNIYVRVATSEAYPANNTWVYNTADEIEDIIADKLGGSDPAAANARLPDWIKNSVIPTQVRGEDIYVPDWLDWISPHRFEGDIRGVVNPVEGDAWIFNHLTQQWRGPARAGEFIYTGEFVVVGDDASAQIYLQQKGLTIR